MHPGHLGFIWLEQKSKCVTKDELWLFHSSSITVHRVLVTPPLFCKHYLAHSLYQPLLITSAE